VSLLGFSGPGTVLRTGSARRNVDGDLTVAVDSLDRADNTAPMTSHGRIERARTAAASVESAALAGAASAVLLALSIHLIRQQPSVDASDAELVSWYADAGNRRLVMVGLNLAPFSAIGFLWFIAVIRRRLGEREDQFFATVFLTSGVGFAVLSIAAAAAAAAPVLIIDYSSQTTPARDTIVLAGALRLGLFVFGALRLAAVFMTVTSTIGQRFNALPRWLSLAGLVMAAVLFVHDPFVMLFPIWLIVVSITLLVTTRRRDQAAA
jgi:hypothetical protein